jgi:hypothetical protein
VSTLQTIPAVHQEIPSEQSVLRELPELMSFIQTNQARTTICQTDSTPQTGWAPLGRRRTSSRTVGG